MATLLGIKELLHKYNIALKKCQMIDFAVRKQCFYAPEWRKAMQRGYLKEEDREALADVNRNLSLGLKDMMEDKFNQWSNKLAKRMEEVETITKSKSEPRKETKAETKHKVNVLSGYSTLSKRKPDMPRKPLIKLQKEKIQIVGSDISDNFFGFKEFLSRKNKFYCSLITRLNPNQKGVPVLL